ncbi:right-handed parallel beta-helix repeat-containing protein [Streptomyces aurantiogriseus]|uniref:Right handed beta helix domain-containing protein n=1 Tax=Streptomyces aurantiogriseus TaxID=66870 RepID=A0A918C603_9ACTN|nr:right-handed parallel beta-helix repeat-containing protein [Streptomyces aurantiogriseus]GGR07565.1 hypothetical protein GCM10010251_24370 [Streptomyces aurantiogriseus]
MLTVKYMRGLALAALLGTSVSGTATPAAAGNLPSGGAAVVPCGDVAELTERIDRANALGAGAIVLAPGCTYTLTAPADEPVGLNGANGLPTITGRLVIIGPGATITRGSVTPFRIAEVAAQGSLVLAGVTISGGSATAAAGTPGGGILNQGTLTVVNSRITDNTASGAGGGIAVASGARAQLANSTVSENTGSDGGGLHVGASGRLTVATTSVVDNTAASTGGGLATFGTTVLSSTKVRENTTVGFEGGGIYTATGTLTVNAGRIEDNTAGSYGGGIANWGSTVHLRSTVVDENTATDDGGGLYNNTGTTRLISSRVTDNTAQNGQGGGVYLAGGSVSLTAALVAGNDPDQCAPAGSVSGCS